MKLNYEVLRQVMIEMQSLPTHPQASVVIENLVAMAPIQKRDDE